MKFALAASIASMLLATPAAAEQRSADDHMDVARYYSAKDQHLGAINRLRIVLLNFQTSEHVPEALARIAKSYLVFGFASEAQTAVAVLDRKFPGNAWSAQAHATLESAALAPFENEQSWISKAFK